MSVRTALALRYVALAVAAFALFVALGLHVLHRGEPAALAAWQASLVNHSTLVAWWLTWTCYPYALLPIAIVLLLFAWRFPEWRTRIVVSVVVLLLCWRGADFFQHLFARPRQLDWVVKRERSFSYPSSHATIAVGFYGLWALMLFRSELPRPVRNAAAVLLAALVLGIWWARMALGAHYLTDLAGGGLLAVAIVAVALAVAPSAMFSRIAGRS